MQYKIPVQIENEDPIFMGLSLRQLAIIFWLWGLGYGLYQGLEKIAPTEIAVLPFIVFTVLGIAIAKFKIAEMTFIPFVLSKLRQVLNQRERIWSMGVDSFSALDIGYIQLEQKNQEKVDFSDKMSKMKNIEKQLEKI